MPFKDKAALNAWRERNRDKVRASNRRTQKTYWTKHERPKSPPFDLKENRRRIRELKVLGIHLLIIGSLKHGFAVVPKLFQSANVCVDCGTAKRLMMLDSFAVKIPPVVLRFPYEPLNERSYNREAIEANFKFNHCEHLRFDNIVVARGLAFDYRPQCYCDFTHKRRITLDSFQTDIAFCRECWERHAADNFNFDYCPPCFVKLLDSKHNFARLPLHSQWEESKESYALQPSAFQTEIGFDNCKHCNMSISYVHSRIRERAGEEWRAVQREVRAMKFAIEANTKYAFTLEKDWSLENEFEKFRNGQKEGLRI